MAKGVLITPAGDVTEIDLPKFEDCQKAVGGYVESLPFAGECHAYVNEDGIEKGLPRNAIATALCFDIEIGLMPGDYIKGNFLIVCSDAEGDPTDVPAILFPLLKLYVRGGMGTLRPKAKQP